MCMLKYERLARIAILSHTGTKTKEVNLISYNGGPPVLDFRTWRNGERTAKGITVNGEELEALITGLQELAKAGGLEDGKAGNDGNGCEV